MKGYMHCPGCGGMGGWIDGDEGQWVTCLHKPPVDNKVEEKPKEEKKPDQHINDY